MVKNHYFCTRKQFKIMKKLLTLLFSLVALASYSQIFKTIEYYDKFDDSLKKEVRKTLITKTDSTFVIEEKGKAPVVYYILNDIPDENDGSKDNIVNLIGDVYGYQKSWCIVLPNEIEDYRKAFRDYVLERTDENKDKMKKYWLFATHRTVTTRYAGKYITEFFWISDELNRDKLGKGVSRIIYGME